MKENKIYPAVFAKEEDGSYNIVFPDLDGAFTCGADFQEALYMAKDCLELNLSTLDEMPPISDLENIKLNKGEHIVMIQADMLEFKKKYDNKLIKKTLTLPKWLNDLGVEKKVNFSKILQEALKERLEIL